MSTGEGPREDEEEMGGRSHQPRAPAAPRSRKRQGGLLPGAFRGSQPCPPPGSGPESLTLDCGFQNWGEALLLEARGVWSSTPATAGGLPREPAGGGPAASLPVPAAHTLNCSARRPAAQP